MEEEVDDIGENIWCAFSWRAGISSKTRLIRTYFENLSFPECQRQMLDFLDTYFAAYFDEDAVSRDIGLVTKFKNANVVQVLSDEFFFGSLDDAEFSAVQELKLLEILCGYFEGDKVDPVKYLVFDCLFGNVTDEEIKDISREIKINFLAKLLSIAVGIKCKLALEYCALMFQKIGWNSKCYSVVMNIVKDFCFMVPPASCILEDIVQISPNFARELTELVPVLYSFNDRRKPGAADEEYNSPKGLPPIALIRIIGSWLTNQTGYCMSAKGHPFSSFPSVYVGQESIKKPKVDKCAIIGLLHWSVLSPLFADVKIKSSIQGIISYSLDGNAVLEATKLRNASSQLHYGIINFFAMHRKVESNVSGDEDDLEPGEVSEQAKQRNLINESDIKDVIDNLDETVQKLKDHITEEKLGYSIDRLAQIIQVGKWSGCLTPTSKKFKHVLKKLPKTKLFSKVLKTL